jgi:hypothetical protein
MQAHAVGAAIIFFSIGMQIKALKSLTRVSFFSGKVLVVSQVELVTGIL